jgi:cytochrome c oxidase cbb3-type subunit 1
MYVARALGGLMYMTGAIIMCVNLWLTATRGEEKAQGAQALPAE